MLILEPTRYKTGEKYHSAIQHFIQDKQIVWLPSYSIAVSKGYPGILHNPKASSLIQVELFTIDEEDIEDYKSTVAHRHMTWENVTEVYTLDGKAINSTVLVPVLKPINTVWSVTPIYYLADDLANWTEHLNKSTLEQKESIARKESYEEWEEKFYPTAMEL